MRKNHEPAAVFEIQYIMKPVECLKNNSKTVAIQKTITKPFHSEITRLRLPAPSAGVSISGNRERHYAEVLLKRFCPPPKKGAPEGAPTGKVPFRWLAVGSRAQTQLGAAYVQSLNLFHFQFNVAIDLIFVKTSPASK